MDKPRIGQASIEFLVVLGVVLMIFIMLGYFVYQNYVKSSDLKVYMDGKRLANTIADNINAMNALGDGYSTSFRIPSSLYGNRNYTVSFFQDESSVFLEGSSFATSRELTFSSPISTDNIHCLLRECNSLCNESDVEECLQVDGAMRIRLVKYAGSIYFTPEHNVMQRGVGEVIVPYGGVGDVDPNRAEDFVRAVGDKWNVMYVYRNFADDSITLVFSLNLTGGEVARMDLYDRIGDVVEVKSNDAGELNLDVGPGAPEALWRYGGTGTGDLDGGSIKFRSGFHVCIDPSAMPPGEWLILNSDGGRLALNKDEDVCITYP